MINHRDANYEMSVLLHILKEDELLDIHDKTSLVFLMCDDAVEAHSILTRNILECKKYNKILPDLVGYLKQTEEEIFNKFLESLILIKNHKVVKQLRSDINNLKEHENKQYINFVRKALYRMCESLFANELTYLIGLIEQDFKDQGSSFTLHKNNLMEFNLLYLICEDYISDGTDDREPNVENLIRHLTKMNKHDLANELQKVHKIHFVDEEIEQSIMCPDNDFLEKNYLLHVTPKYFVSSDSEHYIMDKNNMGLCIIINQRDFCEVQCSSKKLKLSTRTGTDHDREFLKITFTGLGYKIIVRENLSSDALICCLKKDLQSVQKMHCSFVLCILSHGNRGEIYCIDGIPIKVEDIERMISGDQCPQLLGKPKLIFIQACQGSEYQKAVPVKDDQENNKIIECDGPTKKCEMKIPPTADILTFWATVPGYASFRDPQAGTVFVKTLCACLLKHGHAPNHLEDIVTFVNKQLSQTQFGDEALVSMSQVKHTLTKKLYFPYCSQHKMKACEMLYLKNLVEAFIERFIIGLVEFKHSRQREKRLLASLEKMT